MEIETSVTLMCSILISLCLLSSLVASQTDRSDDESVDYSDNHAKVLILGAGASGIQAAHVFHENSVDDFLIIEGADYIGGRIKRDTFANVTVNLGANWLSPANSPMIDLVVNQFGLNAYPMNWDSVVFRDSDGHVFTDEETDPI